MLFRSYQLAQNEDKTAIFENWCDFLNYFDSSIFVQLSFINQKASLNEFRKRINIPAQEDACLLYTSPPRTNGGHLSDIRPPEIEIKKYILISAIAAGDGLSL